MGTLVEVHNLLELMVRMTRWMAGRLFYEEGFHRGWARASG